MAVPKKRTSKTKSKTRKATWKKKAYINAQKSLSLGKSLISGKVNSFLYIEDNNKKD
uniref:Large ribosomal subunit protein bL32c n=1 Tax=Gastroclonium compressum TaxID=1852973 RepID=A0A173FZT3_GASCM|nr:ribosomal protein L32 [Coeloseira compressa]ANH09533.1 ribosomal protein L32 [Coeloseira compressa]